MSKKRKDMNKKIPQKCPSCNHNLCVKSLHCTSCGTSVEGIFSLPVLASLHESDQSFILAFVKSSGSLKEMSRQLNLSYPTVRNMLDDIINHIKNTENEQNDCKHHA